MTTESTEWDPKLYQSAHSFVWKRGADLVEALDPKRGERILDLGCGTGQLTARIAETGASAVGIDSSPQMIDTARANYPELRFEVADARVYRTPETFDGVFSNAALHWIKPPEQAAESISLALKPGGRLIAEFGGKRNVSAILSAVSRSIAHRKPEVVNPWYFPSIGEYASLLESFGLEVTEALHFPRTTPLEGGKEGLRNWLDMFGGAFHDSTGRADLKAALPQIERHARAALFFDGQWHADYVRIRIRAVKP